MSEATLSARYVGTRRMRPPKAELHFDISVRNDEPDERWMILPSSLSRPLGGGAGPRIYSIDAYELSGTGRAAVVSFVGDTNCYAMRLAPAAELVLHGLPVAHWGDLADVVELDVVMAEDLLVDGQPLQTFVQTDLLTRGRAEVDATPLSSQATVLETIGPAPDHSLAVGWTGARHVCRRVEIT
jgi:hypothetical protein